MNTRKSLNEQYAETTNAVEEKTRESVLGRLSELKKETAEWPRNMFILCVI